MRFEREALLSLLTDAYFSDSDVELLMKVSRRKRKELRQAIQRGDPIVRPWKLTLPGTSPQKVERRSPRLSMKQAKAETKRLMEKRARAVLGWVFEQGNLFVEAELDGKCVSIPSLWVGRETQLTGSASPDGQPTVEPPTSPTDGGAKKGGGRPRLTDSGLDPDQAGAARRAWTHRQESKTWAYLKSSASGVDLDRKTILKYWKILGLDPPR